MTVEFLPVPNKRICFLLLTGFVSDKESLFDMRDRLESEGYTAIVENYWGQQTITNFSSLTIEKCLSGISAHINTLSSQFDSIVGIGISISGALLIEYAKKKNNLSHIISIGTPFKVRSRKLIAFGLSFYPVITFFGKIIQRFYSGKMLPLLASKAVIEYFEGDFLKNLNAVTTPILLMHGQNDAVTDGEVLDYYLRQFSSTRKEIIYIPEADHVIQYDADIIIEEAMRFIENIPYRTEETIAKENTLIFEHI